MDYILILLFNTTTWLGCVLSALRYAGLWFILRKSGLKGWWALVPFARDYQIGRCAGREPEGRLTCILAFFSTAIQFTANALDHRTGQDEAISGVVLSLTILSLTLRLIRFIYQIRVWEGLTEVYGKNRTWVRLWTFFGAVPALLWGLSPKYVPHWKVEDIKNELAAVVRNGSAKELKDGLSVNLRERTAIEFFEKKYLLRNVHLSIAPGRMVLLLGGSGAGKTVFLDAVSGYEKADAEILLAGGNMYKQYKSMQYQVGYAPQKDTMRVKDTVYNTLMDAAALRLPKETSAEDRKKRVEEVMEIFGLTPTRTHLIEKLSGGQRKRVSIAMELISNPSLFILDEPDSGLDGVMARELMKELRRIADQGKIVIVITHTPDRVIDLFDDVIVLAKDRSRVGRLAFFGTIGEARTFFGKESMEDVVRTVNPKSVGGEERADEFITKFEEARYA